MNLNSLNLILLTITIIVLIYCVCNYFNFKRKMILQNKTIKILISKEKLTFKKLENVENKVKKMENATKIAFLKIRVSVLNLNFSLKQIL